MRRKILIFAIFVLAVGPLLISLSVKRYYESHEQLAGKYECYPFNTCNVDFNSDGVPDSIAPNGKYTHDLRLKFFLNQENSKTEILDLKYDSTDGTFRTHVAPLVEDGVSKVVIYDTYDQGQYYFWDGEKLALNYKPSALEKQVRTAMSLRDDTGGMPIKIIVTIFSPLILYFYYLLFVAAIGSVIFYRKYLRPSLP